MTEGGCFWKGYGDWSLDASGGAADPNECPADTAIRECFEETGLFVENYGIDWYIWRTPISG